MKTLLLAVCAAVCFAQETFPGSTALDDVVEQKLETGHLGPIRMTPAVRLSLLALRGYLMVMMLLVLYHVLDLAGAFG